MSSQRKVEELERVTEEAVIVGSGIRRRLRTEVMRIVVVKNKDGTEVSIVTTRMAEIEGARAHQQRECDAEQPRQPAVPCQSKAHLAQL